ncbi:MAG: D-2-hydroxyacid dehydrogenase [Tissierellia bacterium]|nr:D-2-hydroxyacid dehydrogenase [Tissierellia bacterium]
MNIILYSMREDEIKFIEDWKKENPNVNLTCIKEDLTEDNYKEIKGNELLILSQVKKLTDKIYNFIKEQKIKVIATRSAGYDIYDLDFLKENNIAMVNVPSYSPNAIGEYVLTSALTLTRKVFDIQKKVKEYDLRWQLPILSREMRTLTVGVIGTGRIGMACAKLFKGVGAKVVGYDLYPNKKNEEIVEYVDFDKLLEISDIITLHSPATDDNYHMIDEKAISKMKKDVIIINAARGSLVDIKALLNALDNNKVKACAIDCYEDEASYIRKENDDIDDEILKELIKREDVLYTPHIAFYTQTALKELTTNAIDYAIEVLKTGDSVGKVKL